MRGDSNPRHQAAGEHAEQPRAPRGCRSRRRCPDGTESVTGCLRFSATRSALVRGKNVAQPAGGGSRPPNDTCWVPVDTYRLRRRWIGIVTVLLISVFTAGILGVLTARMKGHEAVLDRRGRRTVAVVAGTDDRYRWLPETATIRYEHDGRKYAADVTVDRTTDFPVGSQIEIVYDLDNPSHAKPVEGWSPSYEQVMIAAFVVLGLGVANSVRRTVTTLLLLRTVGGESGHVTTMWVESFAMTRWWQRWPRQWAALWPLHVDPMSVDAQLYAPIEDLTERTAIRIDEPSTVVGIPEPGQLLVVIQGERVVWPRGRARRHAPRGSAVDGRVSVPDSWQRR